MDRSVRVISPLRPSAERGNSHSQSPRRRTHPWPALLARALLLGCFTGTAQAQPFTETFSTPGTFPWVVPAGVTSITIDATGGAGGGGSGGTATSSEGSGLLGTIDTTATGAAGGDGAAGEQVLGTTVAVTPGETLTIVVGAGGAGGEASDSNTASFETTGGGAGGSGDPAGADGDDASGGVPSAGDPLLVGLLSGGGGGAGGTSTVRRGATLLASAAGGAGGGGGGAGLSLDGIAAPGGTFPTTNTGLPGQDATAGGAGGLCVGGVNPATVALSAIGSGAVTQFCEPDPAILPLSTREQGGDGAPGFTGAGAGGSGGAGAATVTSGTIPFLGLVNYTPSGGSAGGAGANGSIVINGTATIILVTPPGGSGQPIPALPWPWLLALIALAAGVALRLSRSRQ